MLSENFMYRYHRIEEDLKQVHNIIKSQKNNNPHGLYARGLSTLMDDCLIEYKMTLDEFKKLKHIRYYAKNAKSENYGTKSEYRTESLCDYIESLISHLNEMITEIEHLGSISHVPQITEESEEDE